MSYYRMSTMQEIGEQVKKTSVLRTCICGEDIDPLDDLCESCLSYCAKALDVDTDTYEDKMGESRYFDLIRYASANSDDLRMNRNNIYWTTMDF